MILNKTYKIPKIFYKEEVGENSSYRYCMNFFFQIICMLFCVIITYILFKLP